jgi:hypothetical protein
MRGWYLVTAPAGNQHPKYPRSDIVAVCGSGYVLNPICLLMLLRNFPLQPRFVCVRCMKNSKCSSRHNASCFTVLVMTESKFRTGSTQPPINWVWGALCSEINWPGVKLTTHLYPVPRLRMRGATPPLLQICLNGVVLS